MATFGTQLRRGLPRRSGGDLWPPAGSAPAGAVPEVIVSETADALPATVHDAAAPAGASAAATTLMVRRGLPRVPGGEPWPPAAAIPSGVAPVADVAGAAAADQPQGAVVERVTVATAGSALRRGLPRVAGGEPWPPAGFAPDVIVEQESAVDAGVVVSEASTAPGLDVSTGPDVSTPLPFVRTVRPGPAARAYAARRRAGVKATAPEPVRIGPFTKLQWAGAVIVGGGGLLVAAAMAVLAVRWLLSLEPMQDFITTYPGEYHLPEGAPVGFPAWLGWQHFFNVFLMVLIIRSGLTSRLEKRPGAFWTSKRPNAKKITLNLWFHQSLDVLWLTNGVIFVVLLFVSGQWMRIVPTSWEVFPNMVSTALQYVSLDWPTENGWVNYNALQQIAYFTTVFIAAPLAAITGVRMSGIWPKEAKALNNAYPIEWARAVHFPVMLYFVAFIAVHVFLVFATGALRNLNHMYAAQGSVDPNDYAGNWVGFWFFVASLVVIAAAWVAARPLVLAPIAKLFGSVSAR